MAFWNTAPGARRRDASAPPQIDVLPRPWLRRAASRRLEAYVAIPDNPGLYRARFRATTHSTVTVAMLDPVDPPPLCGTICTVTFHLGGLASSFLAHTVRYTVEPDNPTHSLALTMPTEVTKVEARRVFRVPVSDEVDVEVVARAGLVRMWGRLVDVSRKGLMFELTGEAPDIRRGDAIVLDLAWPDGKAQLPGIVAHLRDGCCAVALDEDADLAGSGLFELVSLHERLGLRRAREEV